LIAQSRKAIRATVDDVDPPGAVVLAGDAHREIAKAIAVEIADGQLVTERVAPLEVVEDAIPALFPDLIALGGELGECAGDGKRKDKQSRKQRVVQEFAIGSNHRHTS
jgi:hypothetical protein